MRQLGVFLFAAMGYAGICALLFIMQDRMLFFPRPSDPGAAKQLAPWQQIVETPAARLSGWFIPAREPDNAPLVFYFGGNAEDISITGLEIANRADANFVLMNYRGYGESEGSPSQAALFNDALSIYDSLVDSTRHNGKIVVFGRSLGSGVGVYLGSQRKVDAAVLVTPYDSIRNVAQRHLPWLPVSELIRHPFDSIALASSLDIPALFLVAELDQVVPTEHAQRLIDSWAGRKRWVSIEGASHNSIGWETEFWTAVGQLLESIQHG